ncbi:MAG: 4-alpha-glucanotransferase, partial [Alistipes sp.]|nr:4-alpha-glucanotransferase [Alistipes sp.]
SYLVVSDGAVVRREWGEPHRLSVSPSVRRCRVHDHWADIPADKSFYSSAFTDGIFSRGGSRAKKQVHPAKDTLVLSVAAPAVRPGQVLAVAGQGDALGDWDVSEAVVMNDAEFPLWSIGLKASKLEFPFEYKFLILDAKSRDVVAWEAGDNRRCECAAPAKGECAVVAGLRFADPQPAWRGAGVAIPVFALRSEKSFGVGEFLDLELMVDWAVATGQTMIQILPINDTTMTGTWQDSYPYNANSTFALHPQFLHIPAVGKLSKASQKRYDRLAAELNALPEIDYERVNDAKRSFLRELFDAEGAATFAEPEFKEFFDANREWLVPYAAFCALRDEFGTPEFAEWGEYARYDAARIGEYVAEGSAHHADAAFNYFVQYHLHRQITRVRNYAHSRGVVLKGDIPIGISRTSADAWLNPDLFNMDCQAGAPPDDFSVLGQNWGFPTYNWAKMAEDGYAWWQARFRKMAEYFDAYRIDHILGFFRIW